MNAYVKNLFFIQFSAMRFLESTDLLKIEDVLPFFPDFVVIDEFKEEICSALESCGSEIQALKSEMDEVTGSAELIKQEIVNLPNRSVVVEANSACSFCQQGLMTRAFYVFPCGHTFHADCLIKQVSSNFFLIFFFSLHISKSLMFKWGG